MALRVLPIVCLIGSVSAAAAQESRRGPYVGLELGASASSTLRAPLTGISEPTRCDSLLRGGAVVPECPAGTTRELYRSDFDLGAGFGAGGLAGYDWGRARIEGEYSRRYSGSSTSLIGAADHPVTVAKAREWSELSPPFARLSDVLTQQAFVNVYVDAGNGSRWTPYVGVGGGLVRTSLGYGNRYLRKTLSQGYYPDGGVDPLTSAEIPEWQRNAAGTVSAVETKVAATSFGMQVLGGLDFALTERVSLDVKARWSRIGPLDAEFTWDLIRSHEPVLADGVTPYDLSLELDGIRHLAVTLGLKYRF